MITFEDPNNEISGSTLAIGGGSGFGGGAGGTVNGMAFNGFTRGYVIFQNAADLSTSFRQSLNFTRVLTHEIGHAIGLGHTQTDGSVVNATSNIMYPSCCASATPTPPAIGPDDLAGLNFIYPSGAPPSCTYSINPTSASATSGSSSGSLSVSTQAGCSWTASSNTSFLGISSGNVGNGLGHRRLYRRGKSGRHDTLGYAHRRGSDVYCQPGSRALFLRDLAAVLGCSSCWWERISRRDGHDRLFVDGREQFSLPRDHIGHERKRKWHRRL